MTNLSKTFVGQVTIPAGDITEVSTTAQYALGTTVEDNRGNAYRYIKAFEAISEGFLLRQTAAAAWDTTVVVDGAVTLGDALIHVDTNTTAFTSNQYAGYFIFQDDAAGLGRAMEISHHGAWSDAEDEGDIYLVDTAPEAISDGKVLYLWHPYILENCDEAADIVVAVAGWDIASGSYGFVQIGGFHRGVAILAGQDVEADEPICPSTTAARSRHPSRQRSCCDRRRAHLRIAPFDEHNRWRAVL